MVKRSAFRHKERLKVMFGPQSAENFGFLKDISRNGVRIKTNCNYEPGEILKLEIHDNETNDIMFGEGQVVWSKKESDDINYYKVVEMGIWLSSVCSTLKRYTRDLGRV